MSDWKAISPVAATNLVTNPSFEPGVTSWTAGGTNTIAQSTDQSKFGAYSAKATYQDNAILAQYTLSLSTTTMYRLSVWIYVPSNFDIANGQSIRIYTTDFTLATQYMDIVWTAGTDATGVWKRISTRLFTQADALGSFRVSITANPTAGRYIYVDGAMCIQTSDTHTYIDGDQPGCYWVGDPHASTSIRVATSRAGGEILDFEDDLHFDIGDVLGGSLGPLALNTDLYAILPGGRLNNIKEQPRSFSLGGVFRGTSDSNLHSNIQEFIDWATFDAVPKDKDGYQPLRIRYQGATVEKELMAHYDRGLEGKRSAKNDPCFWQRAVVRFLAPDPYWYEIGEGASHLDYSDSASFRYIMARLYSSGQWNNLGPPNAAVGFTRIWAIAIGIDRYVYIGGNFTGWDNVANRNYVAYWDGDSWETLGAVNDFNANVYALVFDADGILYAGGNFTNAHGDADADYIAKWNGTAWSAVAAGGVAAVYALAIGHDGKLYIGGDFTNWGDANGDGIVYWDGTSYTSMGTGTADGRIYEIAVHPNGDIYIVGTFSAVGGVANTACIAKWNGTAWAEVGGGVDTGTVINTIAIASNGAVYVGGDFTQIGGETIARVAMFNGTTWQPLGAGSAGEVYQLAIGPDNILYMGFSGASAGGLTTEASVIKWNGASWSHMDIDSSDTAHAMAIGYSDPIIEANYDIYIACNQTGTFTYAGDTTATNNGTAPAFPKIIVSRDGGTAVRLIQVRNETTGRGLSFDYSLLDGEELVIDLTPTGKTIISSIFGARPDAILAGSDFGTFSLLPGNNTITCFIDVAGGPTVDCYLLWKDAYKSYD